MFFMGIDYQIQTTASDGAFSPRDCVRMASENGISSIAITDHDTVAGVEEAMRAATEFGIEVIAGIEISCEYNGGSIHMLGLGIDYQAPELVEKLKELETARDDRAGKIIDKLISFGYVIDFESVKRRASGGVVTRPHIANELLANPANAEKLASDGIRGFTDVFRVYLADDAKAYVHEVPLRAEDAIRLIHQAGGIAVWSHPHVPPKDYKQIEEILHVFLKWNMEGIETFGSGTFWTEDDSEFLVMLAEKYGLVRSAGSDFHDIYTPETNPALGPTAIGKIASYGYSLEGIREGVLAAIARRRGGRVAQASS